MSDTLIIYTLPTCPTCKRAKEDLTAEGIPFEERDVTVKGAWYDEALELGFAVPIIVRDGKIETGWKGEHG
jgi:thioredoxin reductase (NADPH)